MSAGVAEEGGERVVDLVLDGDRRLADAGQPLGAGEGALGAQVRRDLDDPARGEGQPRAQPLGGRGHEDEVVAAGRDERRQVARARLGHDAEHVARRTRVVAGGRQRRLAAAGGVDVAHEGERVVAGARSRSTRSGRSASSAGAAVAAASAPPCTVWPASATTAAQVARSEASGVTMATARGRGSASSGSLARAPGATGMPNGGVTRANDGGPWYGAPMVAGRWAVGRAGRPARGAHRSVPTRTTTPLGRAAVAVRASSVLASSRGAVRSTQPRARRGPLRATTGRSADMLPSLAAKRSSQVWPPVRERASEMNGRPPVFGSS
jgi:hypothetical protein